MANVLRFIYSVIFTLLIPVLLVRLFWKSTKVKGYRARWWQRFGFVPRIEGRPLWIHAVSVGETMAIAPLVERLLQENPELPIVMTSMTPTGADRVRDLFGDRVQHLYCPYDLPFVIRLFLARVQPRGCMVVETELWPNMIAGCKHGGVPLLIANARLSERSAKGYARFGRLSQQMLNDIALLVAQHPTDAQRFLSLGMTPSKVIVSGSIKFDIDITDAQRRVARQLKASLGGRPVVALLSSHANEEKQFLEAMKPLWQQHEDAIAMVIPRHPERFVEVTRMAKELGEQPVLRSSGDEFSRDHRVYIADTMGEMLTLCGAADVAVMGGSFVSVGGHNPLEPALMRVPVVIGPHHHNFTAITQGLVDAGGAVCASDMTEAVAQSASWLAQEHVRETAGDAGCCFAESQKGALNRLLQAVRARLLA